VSSFSKGKVECAFPGTAESDLSVTEVEEEAKDKEGRAEEAEEAEEK